MLLSTKPRLQQTLGNLFTGTPELPAVITVSSSTSIAKQMKKDVDEGLCCSRDKYLRPNYFYDETGSNLYEEITQQPEYYLTRMETGLLEAMASQLPNLTQARQLVELGSGSSRKSRIILDAWAKNTQWLHYIPIDVSRTMLDATVYQLQEEYSAFQVTGLCGHYHDALKYLSPENHRLIIFLGSSMGNFSSEEQARFFRRVLALMAEDTMLLVGFDIAPHIKKPAAVIRAAYNDPQKVTARFNRNILNHINTVLKANFDLSAWTHRAQYNAEHQQIEMRLVSRRTQHVHIEALKKTVSFRAGESILTEISRKYHPKSLMAWFETLGFTCQRFWSDENRYFGLLLLGKH